MQEQIIRFRHNIYMSGFGVVILGFWNIVKTILSVVADRNMYYEPEDYTELERLLINVFFIVFVGIITLIYTAIHLYIGSNAMKVGKGERRKKRFIIACVLLLVFTVVNIPFYFIRMDTSSTWDTIFAAILVDLTLIISLGDILYSNKMISKLSERKR